MIYMILRFIIVSVNQAMSFSYPEPLLLSTLQMWDLSLFLRFRGSSEQG